MEVLPTTMKVCNVPLANTVGVSGGLHHLLSNEKATKITDKPDERTAASERHL